MRTQIFDISNGAKLKTYLWEDSNELRITHRPAVLIFPGGGYFSCSDREAEPVALAYMSEGYNAFVLKYTVRQGFEPAFEDAQNALTLIRKNAEEWRIKRDKIAVCGFSAGGHLAAAMGTMATDKPNAMILGYPMVIGEDWKTINDRIPGLIDRIDGTAPPCFIFSTFEDETVPIRNSISFIDVLNKYNIPFECHIFQSGVHGLSLAKIHTSSGESNMVNGIFSQWFSMSVVWLKKVLGDVEIAEKPKYDIYPSLRAKTEELAENAETRAILEKYVPSIFIKELYVLAKDKPLYAFLEAINMDKSALEKLIKALDESLLKK